MRIYNIDKFVNGQHALFSELLKIADLVEKHYKPFDGKKAKIQSGDSAAYNKVNQAFRNDCLKVSDMRIFEDSQHGSVWIKADINILNDADKNGVCGCVYYKHTFSIGDIDNINAYSNPTYNFTYKFDKQEFIAYCNEILATSAADIKAAKGAIAELERTKQTIKSGIAYVYSDCLEA